MAVTAGELTAGEAAWQVLRETRRVMEPGLRAVVERLAEPTRTVAGYHFGWWDEHRHLTPGGGGKAVRPALALWCAEAVGGTTDSGVAAGIAVELAHNFTLLHDDVMDGDELRRHRRTVWSVFGVSAAILAGDALQALAIEVLATHPSPHAAEAVHQLCTTLLTVVAGQEADLAFEHRDDVGLDECVAMAGNKTAALLACACTLGALLGGGSAMRIEALDRFGHHLGMAFQLVDDLLGIWGDPTVTGKPRYSDLRLRKKSLPVVAALTAPSTAGHRLQELYLRPEPLREKELAQVATLIEQAGGRRWTEDQAERRFIAALSRLDAADPLPAAAARLVTLAGLITHRDW